MTQAYLNLKENKTLPPTMASNANVDKALEKITLPLGLMGFSGPQKFILSPLEIKKGKGKFFRLREETGHNLEFILMSVDPGLDSIDPTDVRDVIFQNDLIQLEEPFQVFVLISIHEDLSKNGETHVTANLKAPLIISEDSGMGVQMILSQDKYKIRHPLTKNSISW